MFFDNLGSRVREAGEKPALPRNCKRRFSSALPLSKDGKARRSFKVSVSVSAKATETETRN
jgi:hypothetical protein